MGGRGQKDEKYGEEQRIWDEGREGGTRERKSNREQAGRDRRTEGKQTTDTKTSLANLERPTEYIVYHKLFAYNSVKGELFLPPGVGAQSVFSWSCPARRGLKTKVSSSPHNQEAAQGTRMQLRLTRTWAFCTQMIAFLQTPYCIYHHHHVSPLGEISPPTPHLVLGRPAHPQDINHTWQLVRNLYCWLSSGGCGRQRQ